MSDHFVLKFARKVIPAPLLSSDDAVKKQLPPGGRMVAGIVLRSFRSEALPARHIPHPAPHQHIPAQAKPQKIPGESAQQVFSLEKQRRE
jgi:hypothetical protein